MREVLEEKNLRVSIGLEEVPGVIEDVLMVLDLGSWRYSLETFRKL